jgi:hypothetical protein
MPFSTALFSSATVIVVPVAMLLLVMGSIDIIVPFVLNKIYRLTAGIVSAAVFAPVLLMTGGYA